MLRISRSLRRLSISFEKDSPSFRRVSMSMLALCACMCVCVCVCVVDQIYHMRIQATHQNTTPKLENTHTQTSVKGKDRPTCQKVRQGTAREDMTKAGQAKQTTTRPRPRPPPPPPRPRQKRRKRQARKSQRDEQKETSDKRD